MRPEPDPADAGLERVARRVNSIVDRGRKGVRPVVVRAGRPLASALAGKPPKRLSGMLRVRNEEEYLATSVASVVDLVDELVIVDNDSSDGSARIIAELAARHPDRIRAFSYPHTVARYGEETLRMSSTRAGRRSPSFLPNYYNWCIARCTEPYILKWDGDTVATAALAGALERFRASRAQVLWYTGLNVHTSRQHLIKGRPFEDLEPRVFYRRMARYDHSVGNVETLWSPYMMMYDEFSEKLDEPLYFHLKFCKRERFTNLSEDIRRLEEANAAQGEPLSPELRDQLRALAL
jgi:hypothetical protein